MADDVDRAAIQMERELAARIKDTRGGIPAGVEGDCAECGSWFQRLVGGACVPCRELEERRRR